MVQVILRLAFLLTIATLPTGCNIGPWGGPVYTVDPSLIGSGQQAITPRTDSFFANGDPSDNRTHR